MLNYFNLYNVMLLAAEGTLPEPKVFLDPLTDVINLALRVLCGVLVGLTGIKLIMSSIAMTTATGDERQQKKDDLTKAVKNFGITVAITAAILIGGPAIMTWVEAQIK